MKRNNLLYKIRGKIVHYSANFLSDENYLKVLFYHRLGYKLNLNNPKTFNEKLQWLKLNDQHEEYSKMVDKIEAKKYVASIIGEKYIIPTVGVWNSVEEIEWNLLPNQFVIKSSDDSGGVIICKDKTTFDIEKARKKLQRKNNYYKYNKEYPYRNLKHRIIAEKYLEDESKYELKDYKIFCFNGEPRVLFVATDRLNKGEETKFDFFDTDWNHLPFTNGHPNNPNPIEKPRNFNEMLDIARKLSVGIPQVRIDLYNCDGNIYFGEITFFHWSGTTAFKPKEWDYKLGNMINLPKTN